MTTEPNNTPNDDNQDSGLRCLSCDYNLTGVESNRCPECGEEFDRQYLLAVRAGNAEPRPIPIWDDRDQIGIDRAYVQTVWRIWFHPRRFVESFPVQHDLRSSSRFVITNTFCAVGIHAIFASFALALVDRPFELLILIPSVFSCVAAWIFAELFAGYLGGEPDAFLGRGAHTRWRGMMRFYTVNTIPILIGAEITLQATLMRQRSPALYALFISIFVAWCHLLVVLRLAGRPTGKRLIDMFLIAPILGAISLAFCACLAALLILAIGSFMG